MLLGKDLHRAVVHIGAIAPPARLIFTLIPGDQAPILQSGERLGWYGHIRGIGVGVAHPDVSRRRVDDRWPVLEQEEQDGPLRPAQPWAGW